MSIENDVKKLNNLFELEMSTVLVMAQEIYARTNQAIGEQNRLKRPYWKTLALKGCRYSVKSLAYRYYTINTFPELMQKKELKISFYVYEEIAFRAKLLGKWEIRNIKMKSEKGLWSVAKVRQEINKTLRKKGVEVHVCICPTCKNRHVKGKNGGAK